MEYGRAYLRRTADIALRIPVDMTNRIVNILIEACREGRTIFVMGNGGSSATASHFANDMGKGGMAGFPRRFKVICLSDNVPLITAWANDMDYSCIFAEQLRNFVTVGDVVIGFSGSGNSPNVLNAVRLAREQGAVTVGFTGMPGGVLRNLADCCLVVPTSDMQHIEDMHVVATHLIYSQIRDEYVQPLEIALAEGRGRPVDTNKPLSGVAVQH